jgi:hypothetical protein
MKDAMDEPWTEADDVIEEVREIRARSLHDSTMIR